MKPFCRVRTFFLGWSLVMLTVVGGRTAIAAPAWLIEAHAHNDYLHSRPLVDALEQGFCNVEADIWLIDGELRVAHDRARALPGLTLEKLYLDPLQARIRRNGGRVFRGGPPVTLLIDIKSDGTNTYRTLTVALKNYHGMLTRFYPDRTETNAILVVISGERPRGLMLAEGERWAGYDGRLADLDPPLSPHFMPWVSEDWKKVFQWEGRGTMPMDERQRLREWAMTAGRHGVKLRFWGTPELPACWKELREAGVGLISTDDLAGYRAFVEGR